MILRLGQKVFIIVSIAYGDPGIKYKYSGTSIEAKPWSPTLVYLRDQVKASTGHLYNFVLVNRLDNKYDYMSHIMCKC